MMVLTPLSKANNRTLEVSVRFAPLFSQELLMKHKNTLTSQSGFNLIQVDTLADSLADSKAVIRTSYEVVDPSDDVIGRFGSLKEAKSFIDLLRTLDQQDLAL
jgi:hypothetical protein